MNKVTQPKSRCTEFFTPLPKHLALGAEQIALHVKKIAVPEIVNNVWVVFLYLGYGER